MDRWSDDVEAKPSQPFVALGGAVSRESVPMSMASSTYHSTGAKSPVGDEAPARSRARTTLVGLDPSMAEPDDYLHIPDKNPNKHSYAPSWRGIINVLTLLVITLALIMLFAGYPILANIKSTYDKMDPYHGARKGKIPQVAHRPLIDVETPADAKTFTSPTTNRNYDLVFSDEFNTPGRTFWPGDDPYWEALDAWYRGTQDYEWYTPEAVNTTTDPELNATFLQITLEHVAENQLNFRSGMLTSWNKVCFQGGYFEVSTILPGGPSTAGYWPAAWLMGNLGRPGYLATTDGMWPYVYGGCDVGILENQTYPDGTGPHAALHANSMMGKNKQISKLPGMRASACTCPGEDHPGPRNNVARGVPEIDIFEAQVKGKHTQVSQSYQVAPFDHDYKWGDDLAHIFDHSITEVNEYHGGDTQEAVSCVSQVPDSMFWNTDRRFTKLGLEYEPDWNGPGSGSVTFYMDGKPTWTVNGSSLRPDPQTGIGQRTFPLEPMMMILNLGVRGRCLTWPITDAISRSRQASRLSVRIFRLDLSVTNIFRLGPRYGCRFPCEDRL